MELLHELVPNAAVIGFLSSDPLADMQGVQTTESAEPQARPEDPFAELPLPVTPLEGYGAGRVSHDPLSHGETVRETVRQDARFCQTGRAFLPRKGCVLAREGGVALTAVSR